MMQLTYHIVTWRTFFFCQISDFGLAKLMPEDEVVYATTRVLGTFGYFDPEYALVCISIPQIMYRWSQ